MTPILTSYLYLAIDSVIVCRLVNVTVGAFANHSVYGIVSASQPLS